MVRNILELYLPYCQFNIKDPKSDDEEDRLADDAQEVKENSRLSCQILMSEALDGLRVTMAPGSRKD